VKVITCDICAKVMSIEEYNGLGFSNNGIDFCKECKSEYYTSQHEARSRAELMYTDEMALVVDDMIKAKKPKVAKVVNP
jgi:hypothetical protein